jgi:hypothetical protein
MRWSPPAPVPCSLGRCGSLSQQPPGWRDRGARWSCLITVDDPVDEGAEGARVGSHSRVNCGQFHLPCPSEFTSNTLPRPSTSAISIPAARARFAMRRARLSVTLVVNRRGLGPTIGVQHGPSVAAPKPFVGNSKKLRRVVPSWAPMWVTVRGRLPVFL